MPAPYSCIYPSNYGRGLAELLTIWPEIKTKFPKATLDIYYGWNHWGLLTAEKEAMLKKQVKDLEPLEVHEHGMVGHQELAKAFEQASFWTYPCTATETFCITALKAQKAGAIPVICKHTALAEVCRNGFSCQEIQEYFPLLVKAMESAEEISLETRREIGEFVCSEFTWEKIAYKWNELFESSSRKKICLSMVIKNHKNSIARSLSSIKDKIDYWIIVDEGSDDGSIEIAQKLLSHIPGEIHRSITNAPLDEAIALSQKKGDYQLVMSPQEELIFSDNFAWPSLDKDYYFDYTKNKELLVKNPETSLKETQRTETKTYQILPGVIRSSLEAPLQNPSLHLVESYVALKQYSVAKNMLENLLQTCSEKSSLYRS